MKKTKIFSVVLLMVIGAFLVVKGINNHKTDLLTQNIEALSNGETSCNYQNGYKAFTNRGGGAYDCCKVWVNKKPILNEICR